MKMASYCAVVWLIATVATAQEADRQTAKNWHQWRGPEGTGIAPLGNPPTEWSETQNIKWKVAIPGRGSASPIVWGDRIFVLTAVKVNGSEDAAETARLPLEPRVRFVSRESSPFDVPRSPTLLAQSGDQPAGGQRRGGRRGGGFGIEAPKEGHRFVVLCIDRNTGNTIWQQTAVETVPHEGHHETASFASASPVTDGKFVYASFGSRGIYCYDLDGNLQWSKDLGDMRTRFSFGEGASPALSGDTLIVQWDHEEDDFIVALDARTGDEKWRQARDEPSTWATPLIVEGGGRKQVVTSGSNRVRSYDFSTGELLWECGGLGSNPIATPITIDGLVIAMSGHQDPAGIAVPLTAKGDITDSDQLAWQIDGITPYVSTPVLYGDTLYFVKSRNAILSSINAKTGDTIIRQKRLPDMENVYASLVGAAGRIYIASREGTTLVIEHGPELQILANNRLDETIDATPAIVGNELLIRGENHLYCIAEP